MVSAGHRMRTRSAATASPISGGSSVAAVLARGATRRPGPRPARVPSTSRRERHGAAQQSVDERHVGSLRIVILAVGCGGSGIPDSRLCGRTRLANGATGATAGIRPTGSRAGLANLRAIIAGVLSTCLRNLFKRQPLFPMARSPDRTGLRRTFVEASVRVVPRALASAAAVAACPVGTGAFAQPSAVSPAVQPPLQPRAGLRRRHAQLRQRRHRRGR